MENLKTQKGRKELWKNSAPEDMDYLNNLNLDFDLQTGDIRMHSKAMEPDGEYPLFDWTMNTKTGTIEEITRKDNKERIVEREVDPETLSVPDDYFNIELPQEVTPSESAYQTEEAQPETEATTSAVAPVS